MEFVVVVNQRRLSPSNKEESIGCVPTKKKIRRVSPCEEEDPCVGSTKRVRRSNRLCAEGLKEEIGSVPTKRNVGRSEERRYGVCRRYEEEEFGVCHCEGSVCRIK